jgi:cyclic beta-1,2-glucan synthetase
MEINAGTNLYIDEGHLAAFGENTAKKLEADGAVRGRTISIQLRQALDRLRAVTGETASPAPGSAAQWLSDNWYLARRAGLDAADAFARAGKFAAVRGEALLCRAAEALLLSGGGQVTKSRIGVFLDAFQKSAPLPRKALYLFPAALKKAAVEALARDGKSLTGEAAGHLITTLRFLDSNDLTALLEALDLTERALQQDPAGLYPRLSRATRGSYRRQVERLAKKRRLPEHLLARRILRQAGEAPAERRHVGFWLFSEKKSGGLAYIAANVLPTLALAIAAGLRWGFFAGLLLLLPLSAAVRAVADLLFHKCLSRAHVPRLALRRGVPEAGKTLCVISALIAGPEEARDLVRRLEEAALVSRDCGKHLLFGLLADLPESPERDLPEAQQALADAARAIEALNDRYGGGFLLLTRSRVLREGRYMGWERKRGALLELARAVAGRESGIHCRAGDLQAAMGARYILTLDSDTRLTPGSARALIGAMLHPLNRPVIDEKRRVVVSGYGILQPRMTTELRSATATAFTRLFAGQGGIDPYGGGCSEVYMDLTGSSVFAGKGILDVDAFLRCAANLPEGRILSHDALEGAMLRCGLVSDVEWTDAFPAGVIGFYRRAHRWIRGDWQNAPWLLARGKNLSELDRWRLFDSLRRSLVAPAVLLCLLAGFFGGHTAVAATAALSFAAQLLLAALRAVIHRPETPARYHATVIHGLPGALCQTIVNLILLPYEAWTDLSAVCRALKCMLVTHQGLLEWSTAAQSEGRRGLWFHLKAMLPAAVLGLLCLLFAPGILARAAGAVWLASPLLAHRLSLRRTPPRDALDGRRRCWLLTRVREMWAYFDDFMNEENHFLPPDNWQERPPVGLAKRTSPTNIGLGLLAVLTAADLGIIAPEAAAERIDRTLTTVEGLEKWHGHLYNWYDTAVLTVLAPPYVSTVDSGNLCACLLALAQGLREYGQPDLARRAEALAAEMDFAPLLDREKMLLRIGLDTADPARDGGCFDLLAGEARLTAYLAAARGDVPVKVWQRMSRAHVAAGRRRGMASWTGTMFEYLMPELLLPVERASLLDETFQFALAVQKKRHTPWGMSESAYFALDSSLAYRYKAHGVQALALRPGMDEETVVAPYSSFLALALDGPAAADNLRALEQLGGLGPYGFWEALDFTPARMDGALPAVVRCVMAHHLGMSIVAAANAIQRGVWQKRFMRVPAMGAHRCLLAERIPLGTPLLRVARTDRDSARRPERQRTVWGKTGPVEDGSSLCCCVLTNGTYSVMSTSSGASVSRCGDILLYAPADPCLPNGHGLDFFLTRDGETSSLLPDGGTGFSYVHGTRSVLFRRQTDTLASAVRCALCADCSGERRTMAIQNAGDAPWTATLTVSLRPVLAFENDYVNHPAFYGLGLEARPIENGVLIHRLARGRLDACWLCVKWDRPGELDLQENAVSPRFRRGRQTEGWLARPTLRLDIPLELVPHDRAEVNLALGFGADPEQAERCADRALALKEADEAALPELAAALLALEPRDTADAMEMLPHLLSPRAPCADSMAQAKDRGGLWPLGISGDWPLLVFDAALPEHSAAAERIVRLAAYLQSLGVRFDLAVIVSEGGDYQRRTSTGIARLLARYGLEHRLGSACGVHLVDRDRADAVLANAALVLEDSGEIPSIVDHNYFMFTDYVNSNAVNFPEFDWGKSDIFNFYVNSTLPPVAWTHLLTNGRFGCLAADCGPQFLWQENAREAPVTPWINDPAAPLGAERLELEWQGKMYSLFAAPGQRTRVRFCPGAAVWAGELPFGQARVTAFVPPETDGRVLLIETDAEADIHWSLPVTLAAERTDRPFVVCDYVNQIFSARNTRSGVEARFSALASAPDAGHTCDLVSARRHDYDGRTGPGLVPCFAAKFNAVRRLVLVCGTADSAALRALSDLAGARAALEETLRFWQARTAGHLRVATGHAALDRMLSTWAPYQALACRILGRTSIYQSGGAIGFRDQLQDVVSLLLTDPARCRAHILEACRHQYLEGDVQHWWHPAPGGGRGVRTRCSDDLLWLPWAVCEYADKTGDRAILEEQTPWLRSDTLAEGTHDRYETPAATAETATVAAHCRRALDMVLSRGCGDHGLLNMLGGDWNDGMDRVAGESVWLTWFFAHTAGRFGALTGEARFTEAAARCAAAAENAWDGDHFLRGYFADGTPLGGSGGESCRVDSVAQSFAALWPDADREKLSAALDTALRELRMGKLTALFTPPFGEDGPDPGYIRSYGPGFRENGGQYTHAAIWLAMACLRADKKAEGAQLLLDLLPENHDGRVYGAEPFVLPADVSTDPGHFGEAGWTWYTGSAGWYWRVALEDLRGIVPENGRLCNRPRHVPGLENFSFVWHAADGARFDVAVEGDSVTVNGAPYDGKGLPL